MKIEKITIAYLDNDKPIFARVDYEDGSNEVVMSDSIERIRQLKKILAAQTMAELDDYIKDVSNE